ncbi:MAG TPA: MATE family efflux transporter [Gemmatimonadales bacterium]|nr:MATE family efflux transporter [Gemmatimonadales bacterium]
MIPRLPTKDELRQLLRLATPMVLIQVGMMSMGVVDTLIVGHLSPQALAAVALGNLYFFGGAILAIGILMVLDPIVSQAVGAGDHAAISRGIQRGIVLAAILSVPLSLLMLPAPLLFTGTGQPTEVIPFATSYCWWLIPGIPPFLLFVVIRQSLQAMHVTGAILWSIVAANLANAALNFILIFGMFGFQPHGVIGSAWATSISRWLMVAMLLLLAWPRLRAYLRPVLPETWRWAPLRRMLAIGIPIGTMMLLEFAAFAAIALLMGHLGTVQVAGHQVAINLASLTFMVPLGVGSAAAVLVGNAVGRGDAGAARRGARTALVTGAAFMSITALLFLCFPGALARAYTPDAAVIAVAASLIPIAGIFQVFDGLQAVGAGILRGLGDTRVPMLINVFGFWCCGMPVSVYLGFHAGWGPRGLWWGFVAGLGSVAVLLLLRARTRLRRDLTRVQVEAVQA